VKHPPPPLILPELTSNGGPDLREEANPHRDKLDRNTSGNNASDASEQERGETRDFFSNISHVFCFLTFRPNVGRPRRRELIGENNPPENRK